MCSKTLVKAIKENDCWNAEACKELCAEAGMLNEWIEADGENFESIVYAAAEKLGVDIG